MEKQSSGSKVKQVFTDFFEDDALTLSGALAFYGALALSPMLILFLTVTSFLGESTQQQMIGRMEDAIGPQASQMVSTIISNAGQNRSAATLAGILGLATLAFSATGVFAQLQHSLNRIWDVQPKPSQGAGGWVRKRLLGLGLIAVIGLLLLASVVLSAVLGKIMAESGWIWQTVNFLITFAVLVFLFAVVFKYLPDVNITWKHVWVGAAVTALLFTVGRHLIGLYLGYSSVGSPYGAAGSLIVLLLWLYYSAAIVFFGAEITQVYASRTEQGITPAEHAEWLPDVKSKHRHAA